MSVGFFSEKERYRCFLHELENENTELREELEYYKNRKAGLLKNSPLV